jgi:hypothetical protein
MIFYHIILKFYDHEIWSVIYVIYENGQTEDVVFSTYSQQQMFSEADWVSTV